MTVFYNEIDPGKAAWLRNLIARGVIAPGVVDERDIRDIRPDELAGYAQCHFFAGIGIWSYALRQAGWPDDEPVWTASCPCQPFSSAGKREGLADERNLWPAFFHLLRVCRPDFALGEQVASRDGLAWLDIVQADLEGEGYASGALDTCAAGFGAPHIRQRLYWGAVEGLEHGIGAGLEGHAGYGDGSDEPGRVEADAHGSTAETSGVSGLADASSESSGWRGVRGPRQGDSPGAWPARERSAGLCANGGLADAGGQRRNGQHALLRPETLGRDAASLLEAARCGTTHRPGPTNGFWRDADWLGCRDGKWRPVEPGTFPLVDGGSSRVLRLRAYGDGIVAPQAAAFIRAFREVSRT